MPFYAGWGLTEDQYTHPKRQRILTIEELVFAVLVKYPLYLLPKTDQLCRPEDVIAHIVRHRHQPSAHAPQISAAWLARTGRLLQRFR
jgi:capsular polysaccharide export protein